MDDPTDWIGATADREWFQAGALFCPVRTFRYTLWRRWDLSPSRDAELRSGKAMCAFIGLNPSTADESIDDRTVKRCINFAKQWGFGGMVMLNLFGFRETDPDVMKRQSSPVGLRNDEAISRVTAMCGRTVCCWGVHGPHRGRDFQVKELLSVCRVHHLGLTKDGHPKHPLYLAAATVPEHWRR